MGRLQDAWKALWGTKEKGPIVQLNPATGKWEPDASGALLLGGMTTVRRGDREVVQSYKTSPWFHSVLKPIAESVASTPWRLYAMRGKGPGAKYLKSAALARADFATRQKLLADAARSGELQEIEQHPLIELLERPNSMLSGYEMMFFSALQYLMVGEVLWEMGKNPLGMPEQLIPYPKTWVQLEVGLGPEVRFRVNSPGSSWVLLPEDAVWFRHVDPENPYARGTGTGAALADEIQADEGAAKRVKNFFEQNALPESVVSFEGAGEPAVTAAREEWQSRFRGVANAFRNLFTNKRIQVERLDTNFKEMTLVELRRFYRDTNGQVYGLPPELRGILESSNRATIEAADFIFAKHVQVPLLEMFRRKMQSNLVPLFDERLILAYPSPIPEDKEFRQKHMVAVPGVFRIDEHRELVGLPPLPDGEGEELYTPVALPMLPAPSPAGAPAPEEEQEEEEPEEEESGEPPWVKQLEQLAGRVGRLERGKGLGENDIENVLAALRPERLTSQVMPVQESFIFDWGRSALRNLGVETSFDMQNPLVRQIIQSSASRVVAITDTTRERLRSTLRDAVSAGEGIDAVARRIREEFDFADTVRSRTIARTEVLSSANGANFAAWDMSGVVEKKRWVHNLSADPRPEHQALDGAEVGIRDAWTTSSGHSAQHPGGFGVAEEDINCRCGMRPVVSEPKSAKSMSAEERADFFKRFDEEAAPWEGAVTAAAQRGFAGQMRDVLAALDGYR